MAVGLPRDAPLPHAETNQERRHHLHETVLQKAVRQAVRDSRITKHASCHTFRHSFATHLLENGVNPRVIMEIMGHKNIETTRIYLHVMDRSLRGVRSPLDRLRCRALARGRGRGEGGDEDR